jgi:hypothetical protein
MMAKICGQKECWNRMSRAQQIYEYLDYFLHASGSRNVQTSKAKKGNNDHPGGQRQLANNGTWSFSLGAVFRSTFVLASKKKD